MNLNDPKDLKRIIKCLEDYGNWLNSAAEEDCTLPFSSKFKKDKFLQSEVLEELYQHQKQLENSNSQSTNKIQNKGQLIRKLFGVNSNKIMEIGAELASGWGGECYDFDVDLKNKEVVYYCVEAGEKFITSESFKATKDRIDGKDPYAWMRNLSKEELEAEIKKESIKHKHR